MNRELMNLEKSLTMYMFISTLEIECYEAEFIDAYTMFIWGYQ